MAALLTRRSVLVGAVASATAVTLKPRMSVADQPTIHDVKIQNFKFVPDIIEVELGDVIKWTNEDLAPHTATAVEFGWDTEEITNGASAEVTVTEGMEASYFCAFHPNMTGSIKIS